MSTIELSTIEPFEICSIRPPTENTSLTFRLSRNCYWNKCSFCPVYKRGAKYSKRSLEEVKQDVDRAKKIDDLLLERGIASGFTAGNDYGMAALLIDSIKKEKEANNSVNEQPIETAEQNDFPDEDTDPRLIWFLSWFKEKPSIEDSVYHLVTWRLHGGNTCFLGDADSLILSPDYLSECLHYIQLRFPSIERFTVYGRTKSAAQKRSVEELIQMKKAGLDRVHFGIESGSDQVLQWMNKGETSEDHIIGSQKVKQAGLSPSAYVIPGLGGKELSVEHANQTARVLTKMEPDYIRIRTLEIFPQTPVEALVKQGDFTEADEETIVKEIKILIEDIQTETQIFSDSATNLLQIQGKLPDDRERMLETINEYLDLTPQDKLQFSLKSRINAFISQYGSLTFEILQKLSPYLKEGTINVADVPPDKIKELIKMVRSKLMP